MKKIASISAALLLLGFTSHSQVLISLLLGDKLNSDGVEFGIEGGYNLSQISGLESKGKLGNFNLGFYFDIRLRGRLSLSTGVLVKSTLGLSNLSDDDLLLLNAKTYEEDGSYEQKIGSFLVPIMLRHKFKNKIYIEGGIQSGLMHKSWIEFTSKNGDTESKIKQFNTEDINRINFGLIAGSGYSLMKTKGITIGVKYYYGLLDVYKNISNTKNSSLFLKLNIPIGAGKKVNTEIDE